MFFLKFGYIYSIIYHIAIFAACAYSLYHIAKRNGIRFPYIAFVPILQFYVVGSICEEYELLGYRIKRLGIVMCLIIFLKYATELADSLASVWLIGLSALPLGLVSGVVGLALSALIALILHKFYYLFVPGKALLFAILSMLGWLPVAIILFLIKDIPMQMSAGAYRHPFANKIRR